MISSPELEIAGWDSVSCFAGISFDKLGARGAIAGAETIGVSFFAIDWRTGWGFFKSCKMNAIAIRTRPSAAAIFVFTSRVTSNERSILYVQLSVFDKH